MKESSLFKFLVRQRNKGYAPRVNSSGAKGGT